MCPAPIHLLLGSEKEPALPPEGAPRGSGSTSGEDACREKGVVERPRLGSWVVLEAEKQLVSKAGGLVCTGGIVRSICASINTRINIRTVLLGWCCS